MHFSIVNVKVFLFFFAFLQNCFLCWDRWNGDVTPTLDMALLCSSRAGTDLGRESGLVWGAYISKHKQPYSLLILITHVCGSGDHINIEHAHSGYSLPKQDSIHRRRVKSVIRPPLYPQATTAGLMLKLIPIIVFDTKIKDNSLSPFPSKQFNNCESWFIISWQLPEGFTY